jgi:hypothetical protein
MKKHTIRKYLETYCIHEIYHSAEKFMIHCKMETFVFDNQVLFTTLISSYRIS